MSVSIAVLATLDTKGTEARFVGGRLAALGHVPVYVDLSLDAPHPLVRDLVPDTDDYANAELDADAKHAAMQRVVEVASAELLTMIKTGAVRGFIGLGGGQGTWLVSEVAKRLPLGFPKLLVTTLATRAGTYLEGTDVTVVPSITDIAGLNSLLRGVLERAAGAIVGATTSGSRPSDGEAPLTAMTMFGVTTKGGTALKRALEEHGVEVAVFHANGNGGSIMESLVESGAVSSVLDWTTTELADELLGGIATAGPDRLSAAGRAGLPQLVVPGALDIVNFGRMDSVPDKFRSRVLHRHTPAATLMRANADDMRSLARMMARKLNAAIGPVAVVVPEFGFSALSAPNGAFHDPDADSAWVDTMRSELDPQISITVHPYNINDPEFAALVARNYLHLLRTSLSH